MFSCKINRLIELRLIERQNSAELLNLINSNHSYWRQWHPLLDIIQSLQDIERFITAGLQQFANGGGFNAGIWFEGHLCGMIYHLNLNWPNRSTGLSYWLDKMHEGKGIMTASCCAVVSHAFNTLRLNRVSIECATENTRSRAVPERLGFKLEGIIREAEWLYDHFVDHALYSLLKSDYTDGNAVKPFQQEY